MLVFDIFHSSFFAILHYVSIGISYFRHYFYPTFLPFDVFSFRHFLPFDVLSVNVLSNATFCSSTFFTVGFFYFDILSVNHLVLYKSSHHTLGCVCTVGATPFARRRRKMRFLESETQEPDLLLIRRFF